jgi:hypothetical protein
VGTSPRRAFKTPNSCRPPAGLGILSGAGVGRVNLNGPSRPESDRYSGMAQELTKVSIGIRNRTASQAEPVTLSFATVRKQPDTAAVPAWCRRQRNSA